MNKALDYNGLLEAHKNKLQLKKQLSFPLWAEIKYDGNFVTVVVNEGAISFITSGGLTYTHSDSAGDIFKTFQDGVYECERIHGEGKLGDRVRCNLHGPKNAQLSVGHNYIVFDYIPLSDWYNRETIFTYSSRINVVRQYDNRPEGKLISTHDELDNYLKEVVNRGYEGLMLKQFNWKWKNTKSRTIDLCKYKKRRTADLKCIGVTDGEGKYEGKIGALVLQDSSGRVCSVGSGLTDSDRSLRPEFFVGRIIELEFEQIIDTYIQPTFIRVRFDKEESD